MRRFEELTFIQLIDKLAVITQEYTKVLKENRNSEEHASLRDEIQELIIEIDYRRNGDQTTSSNPQLPGHQFLLIRDV